MQKLFIVILSADDQPQYVGGIKRVTSILGLEWLRMGHEVLYVTSCDAGEDVKRLYPDFQGIRQCFLPKSRNLCCTENLEFCTSLVPCGRKVIVLNPHIESWAMSMFSLTLSRAIGANLVQALHFHPDFELETTKAIYAKPCVYVNKSREAEVKQALLYIYYHLWKKYVIAKDLRIYRTRLYRESDLFVALSESFLRRLQNKYIIADDYSRLIAIQNPCCEIPDAVSLPKLKVVLWSGRMDFMCKRIDRMLYVWKRISPLHGDWRLKIIGSGDVDLIKNIVGHENLANVEVLGFVDPRKYYEEAAIVCSTSTTEGWGMTLVESAAYGCVPVAFNNHGSVNDIIVSGRNGIIVTDFNLDEYVSALSTLMDDESLLARMGEEARAGVGRFDKTATALKWVDRFLSL